MVREIKEHMLGEAITRFRSKAFEVITHEDAPNVYPHTLMLLGSMMHGVAQALAIMVSKAAEEAAEGEGPVTVETLLPVSLCDDNVAFSALLMLRMHRVVPGYDGGVLTEISPNIISGAVDDFKKLYGRDLVGISSMLTDIIAMEKELPQQTHNYTRTSHLN